VRSSLTERLARTERSAWKEDPVFSVKSFSGGSEKRMELAVVG
jgi:hypothetical protein